MEKSLSSIERMTESLVDTGTDLVLKIVFAIIIYFVGRFLINRVIKAMSGIKSIGNIDKTAQTYILNLTKAALYAVLTISIIAELGVPMSSMIALLAAAGATVGLALQGALANFAGGLMLLTFRPFNVDDYIECGEDKGYVKSISLLYTVLRTFDNKIISIPNGTLMNSNITNATSEPMRRVDLTFNVSADATPADVRKVMLEAVAADEKALKEPEPVVVTSGMVSDGNSYTVRIWAKTEDYWTVYEGLMEEIPAALTGAGIQRPQMPIRVHTPVK